MNVQKKITIGIPTYKRNHLLIKTLNCLKNQTFKDIDIYVSNNSTDNQDIDEINKIKKDIENEDFKFSLIHQKKNIGSINNLLFLLNLSNTKYFMWLCDDDEISPKCLEILISDIENNSDIISVAPYWSHITKEGDITIKAPVTYSSNFKILRVINFLFKADDAFFYGLHKTKYLKKCEYLSFWSINKNIINWAYPYIFQIILKGKVFLASSKDAVWYNREFSYKHTLPKKTEKSFFLKSIFFILVKKINVHYLYSKHIFNNKNLFLTFLFFLISPIFWINDLIKIFRFK